jgi:hypothetical protein
MLLGQVLTPRREDYIRLGGTICANGLEADCAALLMYLQAACTLQTGQMVPTVQHLVVPVLHVNAPLFFVFIRDNIVHRDFPWLQEPAHQETGLHVACAIVELVTELCATRTTTAACQLEDATTPLEGKWEGGSLQLLVQLTQQGEHHTLPHFWIDLAAAPK